MIKVFKESKYILIFVLALIAGILTFFYFIIKPKLIPSQPELPPVPRPKVEKRGAEEFVLGQFEFIGKAPEFPKKISILKTTQILNGERLSQEIALKLNLNSVTLPPEIVGVKRWQNQEFTLKYLVEKNIIKISRNFPQGEKPNLASAQESVKVFLNQLGIWQDSFKLIPEKTQYFLAAETNYLPIQKNEEADIIKLYYRQEINSLPLFQTYSEFFPLKVEAGPNNLVYKIEYSLSSRFFENLEAYPLLSIEKAVEGLNWDKGELISLNIKGESLPLKSKTITSARLSKVDLVYFYSPGNELIIPSFIFEGEATLADNQKAEISVLIPAIPEKYLIPAP